MTTLEDEQAVCKAIRAVVLYLHYRQKVNLEVVLLIVQGLRKEYFPIVAGAITEIEADENRLSTKNR